MAKVTSDRKVEALIYDLGGVLMEGGLKNFFRNYPRLSEEDRKNLPFFLDLYDDEIITGKRELSAFLSGMAKLTGIPYQELHDDYFGSWRPIEGMPEHVERQSRKYRLAILSNLDKERKDFLESNFEFLEPFKTRVYSCDMGFKKPDRRIYQAILDILKLPGIECAYTDNRKDFMEPARPLGIITVPFRGTVKQLEEDFTSLGIEVD